MVDILFNGLWGTLTAKVFTSSIATAFLFSCIVLLAKKDKAHWVSTMAPGILTSLGLFGTFWGIAQSLGHFDVSNIDSSVIELLGGMKLAFWTSILGMLCALLLNSIRYVRGCFSKEVNVEAIGAKEIHAAIIEEQSAIRELRDAIGGDKDTSLLSQIQKLRTETSDMKQSILDSFNSFAAKVTENNSKALIEALREVITDFNAKINEQFGDNFKQLNEAVGALLEWQENYRVQIEAIVSQIQISIEAIESTKNAIVEIKENTDAIPKSMQQLKVLVETLDKETEKAHELLMGFSALRTQAEEVFPSIKKGMDNLTSGLTESIDITVKTIEQSVEKQNATIEQLGQRSLDMALHMEQAMKQGVDNIQGMFKTTLEDIETSTKDSFKQLDMEMERALSSVITAMGSKLASVSEKLVIDYQALTQKIAQLLVMVQQQRRESIK